MSDPDRVRSAGRENIAVGSVDSWLELNRMTRSHERSGKCCLVNMVKRA